MNNKKINAKKEILYKLLGVVFLLIVWTIYSVIKANQGYNPNLFPNPIIVFRKLIDDILDKSIWIAIGWTFLRLLIGFGISFILAGVFGILSGFYERFKCFLSPLISIMKSTPTAAITFIILIILGQNWTPCALVFLVCFPIIYESFVKGIQSIDSSILKAASLDTNINKPYVVINLIIPSIMPFVSLSILTSLGLAMKVSVMAEIVAGGSSSNGLGRLIYIANQIEMDIPNVYALSIIAILIISIFNLAIILWKKKSLSDK